MKIYSIIAPTIQEHSETKTLIWNEYGPLKRFSHIGAENLSTPMAQKDQTNQNVEKNG